MSTAAPMRPAPWTFAAPWGARGYVSDIDGPVHWIEFIPVTARTARQSCSCTAAAVGVPVLLIGGGADRLVPAASMRQAAARNPRWETVMLPGAGHTPQLEAPDTVIGTVRDWLGRTTSGTH